MKKVKLHLPEKLESMFDEARPELQEVDTFVFTDKRRGLTQTSPYYLPEGTKFCEYIEKCNEVCFENTERYNSCRKKKFWDKHGVNYGR